MPTSKRKTTRTPAKKNRACKPEKQDYSQQALLQTGLGQFSYIKPMSSEAAEAAYPAVKGLPKKAKLFLLCGADGTPIALTDSEAAAIGHAHIEKLWVERLH
jgi:hypothetical protein